MVKNELIHPKTYKKTFYHVIFTVSLLRLKKELLTRKFLMVAAENPTVRIERRLIQVSYTSYSTFLSV